MTSHCLSLNVFKHKRIYISAHFQSLFYKFRLLQFSTNFLSRLVKKIVFLLPWTYIFSHSQSLKMVWDKDRERIYESFRDSSGTKRTSVLYVGKFLEFLKLGDRGNIFRYKALTSHDITQYRHFVLMSFIMIL